MLYRDLGSGEKWDSNLCLVAQCIHAIARALTIAWRRARAKSFCPSYLHPDRQSKSDRTLALADSTCRDRDAGTRCPAVLFAVTNDDVPFQNSKRFQYVQRSVALSLEWNLWVFDVLANIRSATLGQGRYCRIARFSGVGNMVCGNTRNGCGLLVWTRC